jgi:hypothetical protein
MIPQIGQHVKCIFRNGTIVEGIVENWAILSHETTKLRSLTDQSLMIICHPKDDIMMIKIMPDTEEETETLKEEFENPQPIKEQIRAKLQKIEKSTENEELQDKTVGELKKLVIDQEKQILVDKIKEHFPGGNVKKSNYTAQTSMIAGQRKTDGKS